MKLFYDDNYIVFRDLGEFELWLSAARHEMNIRSRSSKGEKYYDVPFSFDIETTNTYNELGQKIGFLYIWQFGVCGHVVTGRTWPEFVQLLNILHKVLNEATVVIFDENLAYEFQFLRKWIPVDRIFAFKERKPIYFYSGNIKFACSYILTGKSLEKIGNDLNKYKVRKRVENLDYSLVRHSGTPLSEEELSYCYDDVRVLNAFIAEKIERGENICYIPNTKTAYARQYMRRKTLPDDDPKRMWSYKNVILRETITDSHEYLLGRKAFQGGFTHARAQTSGELLKNVMSKDINSSYPTVMCCKKYPCGAGVRIDIGSVEEVYKLADKYCLLLHIRIRKLRSSTTTENILGRSNIFELDKDTIFNNGRVVDSDNIEIALTETDFIYLLKFYKYESIEFIECYRFYKTYLPKAFVEGVLELYETKTKLKNVEGNEIDYQLSKEQLNSMFGMCCTSIIRPEYRYNGEWIPPEPYTHTEIMEKLAQYNKSWNRFLYYYWGVWITSFARARLFEGILELGSDFAYADTDSLKYLNPEQHEEYFEKDNELITEELNKACKFLGIAPEKIRPKTKDGIEKPLGVWETDAVYSQFKTLGAKRYIYYDEKGKFSITIAGLPTSCSDYIEKHGAFKFFKTGMYIPPEESGKLCYTYCDTEIKGTITDYLGNEGEYHELSFSHLEPTDFTLSIAPTYQAFIYRLNGRKALPK